MLFLLPFRFMHTASFVDSIPEPVRLQVMIILLLCAVLHESLMAHKSALPTPIRASDPLCAARSLCDLASTRGSMDNITVLVVAL